VSGVRAAKFKTTPTIVAEKVDGSFPTLINIQLDCYIR